MTNELNLSPAANQKLPRFGGMAVAMSRSAFSGSLANDGLSIAATSRKFGIAVISVGTMSCRLNPAPPPNPSTKNAGGPPSGLPIETKMNSEVYSPSSSFGRAYDTTAVNPLPATYTWSIPSYWTGGPGFLINPPAMLTPLPS